MSKNLLTYLGEAIDRYQAERAALAAQTAPIVSQPSQARKPLPWPNLPHWKAWLPSRGNIIFTLLVASSLIWATKVGAVSLNSPATSVGSTGTIAYQGRLADATGQPLTEAIPMVFRLYGAANGGVPLWEEEWIGSNSVQVSDGLFNVMLGSLDQEGNGGIPLSVITGNSNLWLGITVGNDDEMAPRVQLGSVPFAFQALSVPDGSVTTAKLADGNVTTAKLSNGAVTSAKLDQNLNLTGDLTVTGSIKDVTGYVAPVGTIAMYAGTTAPEGWLLCDGAAISRTAYQSLFTVVGITFGGGDGSSTFNLPNLQGRAPFGKANAGTFVTLGSTGGSESHDHGGATSSVPDHQHLTPVLSNDGALLGIATTNESSGNWPWGFTGYGSYNRRDVGSAQGVTQMRPLFSSPAGAHSHTISTSSNVPPFVVVNYIIKR